MIKQIILFITRPLGRLLLCFYQLRFGKLSVKCNALFFSKLYVKGSSSLSFLGGTIIKSTFFIKGENNVLIFEDNVKISNCQFFIIGDNCKITFKGSRRMSDSRFDLLDSKTSLSVGKNTGFNRTRVVVAGENNMVNIGSDCIIAEGVEIWASDTHSIVDEQTGKRINQDQPINIGNHVWLGTQCFITKGVNIGDNSIIGARSVVTKDVKTNSLVVGIPAKEVKNNINWNIKRI